MKLHRAAAVYLCLMVSAITTAQTLDLGGASDETDLEAHSRLLRLIQELDNDIERRLRDRPDGDAGEALAASINTRRLAIALLAAGDELGSRGELHTLSALHIIDALPAIDGLLQSALVAKGALDPQTWRRIQSALVRYKRAVNRLEEAPPDDPRQLDRDLRNTFSELGEIFELTTGHHLASGWAPEQPATGDPVSALKDAANALPEATGARVPMLRLRASLETALARPEFAEQATHLLVRLADAYEAAATLTAINWRSTSEDDPVYAYLQMIVERLLDPAQRADGLMMIDDLDLLTKLALAVQSLPDQSNEKAPLRSAFESIEPQLLQSDQIAAHRSMWQRIAGAALRITNEIAIAARLESVGDVPLIARRGRVQLQRSVQETQSRAVQCLLAIIAGESAAESPANTSLLVNLRSATAALESYMRAIEITEELAVMHTPGVHRCRKRLLQLMDDVGDDDQREVALREIESFVQIYDGPFTTLTDNAAALEEEMKQPNHSGDTLTLVSDAMRLRSEWLAAWGRGRDSTIELERLQRAESLTRLAITRSDLRSLQGAEMALSRWPAWRIPPGALNALIAELDLMIVRVLEAIENSPDRVADAAMQGAMRASAAARLIVRITDNLDERGMNVRAFAPGAADRIGALAIPPSKLSWMHDQRMDLARFSRWLTEQTAAYRAGLRGTARDAKEELDVVALELLDALDRAESIQSP